MLSELPADVVADLCRWLPQAQLLALAQTNKYLYALAHPELYRCIVVDSSKRVFHESPVDDRIGCFADTALVKGCPVVIRSLFALSWFFKTVLQNPHYARYIRCLVVHDNVPDLPALEMSHYLNSLFPLLANVEVLNWYSQMYPLDSRTVSLLPDTQRLASLCGNFSFVFPTLSSQKFRSLQHLDVSNFCTEKVLQQLDLAQFPAIKSLTLARGKSPHALHFSASCCQTPAVSAPHTSFVRSLFNSPLKFPLNLHTLVLRDIPLHANDAILLLENINVEFLTHLVIENCTEVLFDQPENTQISRRNPPASMFLDHLSPKLMNLQSLNLGLSNELCYNTSTFRAISRLPHLQKLAVHIKMFQTNDPVSLAPLVNSLAPHSDTLEYLNICCEMVEQPQVFVCPKIKSKYLLRSLLGLSRMKSLKYLRLPVTFDQISEIPDVLSSLQELKVVQLAITDSDSASACGSCNDTLIYALYNTNCLISQDYFNCPSSFTSSIEQKKNQQYLDLTRSFRRVFSKLAYLRFDLKSQSMLYSCSGAVKSEDSVERFDSLVERLV